MIVRSGQLSRVVCGFAIVWSVTSIAAQQPRGRDWPAVTRDARPWTRWWWQGSAVKPAELTRELEELRRVGIGGVEITPIYGVRGTEAQFIPFLSDAWVGALRHTLQQAQRIGLGVDMATGTGWPFGGPWVTGNMAPRSLAHKTWTVEEGQQVPEPIRLRQTPLVRALGNQIHIVNEGAPGDPPRGVTQPAIRGDVRPIQITDLVDPVAANRNLQALALEQVKYPRELPVATVMGFSDRGEIEDLTARLRPDGTLDWKAPRGRWTVYALFAGWHGKLVERAAPGGEGDVIDHFSTSAIRGYLAPFDRAFNRRKLTGLRGFFNDSYEVDDASGQGDWTPALLDEFRTRRGYDLRQHLPALFGRSTADLNARVLADYRETVSDLLLETFTTEWGAWARRRGAVIRNQAHGAPANLLDLYAASDIPETEGTDIPRFKWATSAANVTGRKLVAAEAATWLGEHFRSTLADVKAAVDHFFIAGVNHVVYHGTAYSPDEDPWPGWQFYAAVEFHPANAWWDDFAALNAYVTRVQSFLQSGRPDHDVLLYFPFHDAVGTPGKTLLTHFGGANRATAAEGFEAAAATLQSRGYTYDYISDRQIRHTRVVNGNIVTAGGARYRTIVVPPARFIPLGTVERVIDLASRGATVVSLKDWPADVSGLASLDRQRGAFKRLKASIAFARVHPHGVREAGVGAGRILRGDDLERLLTQANVRREPLVDNGLHFARRADGRGRFYFVNNRGKEPIDGWMPFLIDAPAATVFEPLTGRRGDALARRGAAGVMEVYLQIPAGGTFIVAAAPRASGDQYRWHRPVAEPIEIGGRWNLQFMKGGPSLPPGRDLDRLVSWPSLGGDDVKAFSGTAKYTVTFPRPAGAATIWQLDLGRVHESARVRLNGRELGTLFTSPFRIFVPAAQLKSRNVLEVSVTNLSANRIADLDRRGVVWKKFYNVNMPARLPENRGPDGLFTAAKWTPLDSGLLGPVTLTPVR